MVVALVVPAVRAGPGTWYCAFVRNYKRFGAGSSQFIAIDKLIRILKLIIEIDVHNVIVHVITIVNTMPSV